MSKMVNNKVGILTFVKVDNYGAELQAFALQNTLRILGYDSEIINFSIKRANKKGYESLYHSGNSDRRVKFHSVVSRYLSSFMRIILRKRFIARRRKFDDFYTNYLHLSQCEYKSFEELCNAKFDYQSVVVGSDQVWNYTMNFSVSPFLLSFLCSDIRRVSYAASFGVTTLVPYLSSLYEQNLSKFSSISVRESSGASIVSNLLNKDIPVVLDPTLLLTKDNWKDLLKISTLKSDYILVYMLTYSSQLLDFADNLSRETGLKVIQIMPSFFSYTSKRYNFTEMYDVNPRDFVTLFYNSSYVLTTSFHGTAFSVNFQKPFYTFVNSLRKNNSRMIELLDKLSLTDRIIKDNNNADINSFKSINFEYAVSQLDELRNYSYQFIKSAL